MDYCDIYLAGTILNNRYEIIKPLGKGGSSKVYLARDLKMDSALLAVKQMTVEYIDYDQYIKAMEDFNREAEVLSRLEHPSIPSLHDFFLLNGNLILIMQYIEGKTLEQILLQSPAGYLEEHQVVDWGMQLCNTLQYIHSLDPPMFYRDLKPANIIFNEKLHQIFLIDFGIARYVTSSVNFVTAVGTFGYAPPELFFGKVEAASDIFSLGATMYNLLTGTLPEFYEEQSEHKLSILPRAINNHISSEMEQLILKMLAGRPEDRFTSAVDLKTAFDEHLKFLVAEVSIDVDIEETLQYPPKEWKEQKLSKMPVVPAGRIKIYKQGKKIAEFTIKKSNYTIGRQDLAKGIIPHINLTKLDKSGKISRQHAQIVKIKDNYYFEDLSSTYGSSLNGERLKAYERRLLRSGDRLSLGEIIIEFLIESGTENIRII